MPSKISAIWFAFMLSCCFPCHTLAEDSFTGLEGTYKLSFQSMTSAGVLNGCSLLFGAAIRDYAYLNGKPVLVVGNITYFQNNNPGLVLKLGLIDYLGPKKVASPPFYAYIRTENGTTSGAKYLSAASDLPGYKTFIYQFDERSTKVLGDLLDGQNPTIGFNREEHGLDVTFQLDLNVADTKEYSAGKLQHIYSTEPKEAFKKCFIELAATLKPAPK